MWDYLLLSPYRLGTFSRNGTFSTILFFNLFCLFLFLAALGLHCCTQAFSSCGKQRLLFVAVRGLLMPVASLVAEHGLKARGLQ